MSRFGEARWYSTSLAVALALVAATLLVYWPATDFDSILLDDPDYVFNNSQVRKGLTADGVKWAFTTDHAANWHPLTWISHMIDVEIVGESPGGHHTINILIHALNVALLFAVLLAATGARWPSALVAALFALHPINVESVAWISERKNTLATALWLLAMLAWIVYARRGGTWRYLLAVVVLGVGLLAKPTVVALPVALLLFDVWPLGRIGPKGITAQKAVLEKVPLFALSAMASAMTILAQRTGDTLRDTVELPLPYRISNALVSYVRYLGKMLWPDDLALVYPHPGIDAASAPWPIWAVIGSAALLTLITVVVVRLARRDRHRAYLAVGWGWYVLTLIPMIGVVQVGPQSMADRYAYVSFIGLFVMVAWGLADLAKRWCVPRAAVGAIALAMVVACALATSRQLRYWKDSPTLFEMSLSRTEGNWLLHGSLGAYRATHGDLDAGIEHLRESIRIHPLHTKTYHNLANMLQVRGDHAGAIELLEEAVRIDPGYARAHYRLGISYNALGSYEDAHEHLGIAVGLVPEFPEAYYQLALASGPVGRPIEALRHLRRAAELRPEWDRPAVALERFLETAPEAGNLNAIARGEAPRVMRALAAGYVAAGARNEAIATAELARDLAVAQGQLTLAAQIDRDVERIERAFEQDGP